MQLVLPIVCIVLLATGAFGAEPAPVVAKPQSPLATVVEYTRHSNAGRADLAIEMTIRSRASDNAVRTLARWAKAVRDLDAAGEEKFGRSKLGASGYPPGWDQLAVESLAEVIDGEKATVSQRDAHSSFQLLRVDGKWKIDLTESLKNVPPEMLTALVAAAAVAETVAIEINAGKFASIEEAREKFGTRRLQAAQKAAAAESPNRKNIPNGTDK